MGCPPFITGCARALGVPIPNYTRPTLYRVGCRCEGYLTVLRGTTQYYTEKHMSSNEERSTFPYYEQSNSKREQNPIWKAVRDIAPIETTKEKSLVVMEHHANRQIESLKKQAALLVKQATEIQNRMELAQLISTAEYSFTPIMLKEYYLYELSGKYTLTLIAPEEWSGGIPYGECVARVRQLGDSTWEEMPAARTATATATAKCAGEKSG
jgi:hypothetical protein